MIELELNKKNLITLDLKVQTAPDMKIAKH